MKKLTENISVLLNENGNLKQEIESFNGDSLKQDKVIIVLI